MINKLTGVVTDKTEKTISLTLFESISFEVFVINTNNFILTKEYTVDCVMLFSTEKGYFIYGFLEPIEKIYFLILGNCHGIGAKMALQILVHLSVDSIYQAIFFENKLAFEIIPGIGKKKAEMIILELKSKITKLAVAPQQNLYRFHDDFIASLKALGYHQKEVNFMVQSVYKLKNDQNVSLSQLIEKALLLEK